MGRESEKAEINDKLAEIGCCKICCLRYLGETRMETYRNIAEGLKMISYNPENVDQTISQNIKCQKLNPCVACLGLLQKPVCDEVIQKVLQEINRRNYDSGTFNVAITLPVVFQLRSHSLWIFMEENYPEFTLRAFPIGCVTVGVKDVWKWLFTPVIESEVNKMYCVESDLFIGISISYQDNENECSSLYKMVPEMFTKKSARGKKDNEIFSRKAVEQAFKEIQSCVFKEHFPVPPNIPLEDISCGSVTLQHNSIFIAGRYNKLSRKLPQTPWIIAGERKMEGSVQEYICAPLEKETQCEALKFVASGREDVDVRTLGRGRPFSIELINPKRTKFSKEKLYNLQESVNKGGKGKVSVRDLQLTTKESLLHLKTGEEKKTKEYSAFCVLFGPFPNIFEDIPKMFPLELSQKTPVRVLHRRPVATRNKTVHWLKVEKFHEGKTTKDPSYFKLKLSTQAGTYIKEFIHGDFGRTKPSLGELLGNIDVDIIALDVQEVLLDWPPEIK